MFILQCVISIGAFTFNSVNEVKITKSVDLLSDTATIKMPISALLGNQVAGFEKKPLETAIKAGDKVSIRLMYEDVINTLEFEGFVTFVKPNAPTITIECEDAVYLIRKKRIHKNFGKTTLSELLKFITQDTGVELAGNIPEIEFDKFIFKNVNGAKALQKLKEQYGLSFFIDDNNKLFAGLRQQIGNGKEVIYSLHKNVIKHQLTFRKAEELRLRIKVVGVKKNNKKVEVIVGDTDGEQRTLFKYNVSDIAKLREIGRAELNDLKYTGYQGTITSFLAPFATRAMAAVIFDEDFPDRKGRYFIVKVVTTFGINGARRNVEIGKLI